MKCFFLNPTDRVARYLRRYNGDSQCDKSGMSYHDARVRIEDEPVKYADHGDHRYMNNNTTPPLEDSRWPTHCACGYEFGWVDNRQLFVELIYQRSDNGEEMTLKEAPDGAMWDADWWPGNKGPDGRCLVVKCPGGYDWMIDGQASNCTMKEDWQQQHHHCWPRRGEPPNITVDKSYGPTCNAGAGSIQTPNFHGFLRNGEFVNA